MSANEGWRAVFDGHAPFYLQNVFTRNTIAEVEFLVRELRLGPGARLLDLGCGTGRHSVELAHRGFRMVGVDLSRGMLRQAQAAAQAAGVSVDWIQADATRFAAPASFDGAICLCEGSFGLAGDGEDPIAHDEAIARNLARCLRPGARLVLTALNGLRLLRQYGAEDIAAGAFDPATLTKRHSMEWESGTGHSEVVVCEHGHRSEDLQALFEAAGFAIEHIGGGTAGNWGHRPLDPEEYEIMLIAERTQRVP
ncbi:MAG: methyltransferase domain-containing protein [Chloroflexi bacterium]|nr:methyltransferase domain-containing protein [Chloroflexota bacterium]